MDKLYDAWAKRNPDWETRFKEPVIERFANYGSGAGESVEMRGKIFGGGYEVFILAFFMGLYANRKRSLPEDPALRHCFGQPIVYWGNVGQKAGRTDYGAIRDYMFAALIARTDIDFIALDKGDLPLRKAVDKLIETMEGYANYGFQLIFDKLQREPDFFLQDGAFFQLFKEITAPQTMVEPSSEGHKEIEPAPL